MVDYRCLKYSNLVRVVSAIFLVKKIYKLGGWQKEYEEYTQVAEKEAKVCAKDLYFMMKDMGETDFSAVERKYSTK